MMRKTFSAAVLLILVILVSAFRHPFYLSVTDLKYNEKEKSLQGTVKIFVSDLEAALKKTNNNKTVDLIHVKDSTHTHNLLSRYLTSHFHLLLNAKAQTFDLIGFEQEEEAVWLYIKFENCGLPKKIEIANTLLFEQIPAQTNIVRISVKGEEKSGKNTNPESSFVFDF